MSQYRTKPNHISEQYPTTDSNETWLGTVPKSDWVQYRDVVCYCTKTWFGTVPIYGWVQYQDMVGYSTEIWLGTVPRYAGANIYLKIAHLDKNIY